MDIVKLDEIEGMRFPAGRHTRVMVGEGALQAERFCQGYVVIPPGASVPEHAHEQEEVYLVLSGNGEIKIGDETRPIQGVSSVYIPSGLPHTLSNVGTEDMVMVFTYAPGGKVGHWADELNGKLK